MSHIQTVEPQTLDQWLKNDEAVLIDVREAGEFKAKSIYKARNLPLSKITITEAHLPEHKHKKLVLQCQTGRRSMLACEKLQKEGVAYDIWNLKGGIVAWESTPLPTISSGRKFLPIDRQVQITVSLMILTGLGLGYWLHPGGYGLTLVAGLGLLNAGLTGWCGMAKFFAWMPWNKA
jgi:rhodanese-related sulfurtransferase